MLVKYSLLTEGGFGGSENVNPVGVLVSGVLLLSLLVEEVALCDACCCAVCWCCELETVC